MNRFKHLIKAAAAIVLTYVLCASALLQPMAVYAATLQTQQSAAEAADASSTQDSSAGDVSDNTANEADKDADSADAAQGKAASADAADEDAAANGEDAAGPESLDAEGERAADDTVIGDSEATPGATRTVSCVATCRTIMQLISVLGLARCTTCPRMLLRRVSM